MSPIPSLYAMLREFLQLRKVILLYRISKCHSNLEHSSSDRYFCDFLGKECPHTPETFLSLSLLSREHVETKLLPGILRFTVPPSGRGILSMRDFVGSLLKTSSFPIPLPFCVSLVEIRLYASSVNWETQQGEEKYPP